jgi:mRNA interferase MazF
MAVKQGEVVLCQFYFSDAKQAKNRPVLAYKDNLPFDDFIGIPISSKSIQHSDELTRPA